MLIRTAYILLIAALAIVGISMSSHSATPAGHAAPAASPLVAQSVAQSVAQAVAQSDAQGAHDHAAVDDGTPIETAAHVAAMDADALCPDCADPHSGILIACAFLALMVVAGILLPLAALAASVPAPGAIRIADQPGCDADPRPPDLTELCISRT